MGTQIPRIKLEPGTAEAIKALFAVKASREPVRIDLNFSGCCDAALCLRADSISEDDIVVELEGLTFVINPEIYELTGAIDISYRDDVEKSGFVLKSSNPVSEWDGFNTTDIKF